MLCKSFEELTHAQKQELLGKIGHLVQTYEWAFNFAKFMIEQSEKEGLFEGIKIGNGDDKSWPTADTTSKIE